MSKELKENIRKYLLVKEDIERFNRRHKAYLDTLEFEIIQEMKKLEIDTFENMKLVNTAFVVPKTIAEIKEAFNDESMIDYLVARIDVGLSIENITLKNGFSEKMSEGYKQLLGDLFSETEERIVIKR